MEDFATILQRDYGLKPQGKFAPMAAVKGATGVNNTGTMNKSGSVGKGKTSGGPVRSGRSSSSILGEGFQDDFLLGGNGGKPSGTTAHGSPPGDMPGGSSGAYDDVFGGSPKIGTTPSFTSQSPPMQNYDDIFGMASNVPTSAKGSSLPVFDAPVFDDDIFGGVPGVRSASVAYDNVFSGGSGAGSSSAVYEDLLGGYGATDLKAKNTSRPSSQRGSTVNSGSSSAGDFAYDELLPGFGVTEPAKPRSARDVKPSQRVPSGSIRGSPRRAADEPFVVSEANLTVSSAPTVTFSDLDPFIISSQSPSGVGKNVPINRLEEGVSRFDDNSSSAPATPDATRTRSTETFRASVKRNEIDSQTRNTTNKESCETKSVRRNHASNIAVKGQAKHSTNSVRFDIDESAGSPEAAVSGSPSKIDLQLPQKESGNHKAVSGSPSKIDVQLPRKESVNHKAEEPLNILKAEKNRNVDEVWITVDDVKLVTQPSPTPPPVRSPPVPASKRRLISAKQGANQDATSISNDFFPDKQPGPSSWQTSRVATEPPAIIDELEEFASGGSRMRKEDNADMATSPVSDEEQTEGSVAAAASAAAMKDAMERAEVKLKLAKEARERGREERERESKGPKPREERERTHEARERDDRDLAREKEEIDRALEMEERAREAREREEERAHEARQREESERERVACEKMEQEERARMAREACGREEERVTCEREERERAARDARDREEKEREEKEREARERRRKERGREREREREKDRIAVERATQEARGRAEAKAVAEARERAERAAVERATTEARGRAAAEAKERAAVERAAAEARVRAERASVDRANAEARERAAERAAVERAAAEARERAERAAVEKAAAAWEQQRTNENDLDAFFTAGSRASSAPRQRPATTKSPSDARWMNKGFQSEGQWRSSTGAPAGVRKVASTTNMADDFVSLFNPTSDEFHDVDGEAPERRRARLERYQRTRERTAKALEEKNQRDLQSQMEQAERHRAAEMLDMEIKRWAAGKQGNLRALLSTLQYVLWPESGWQSVSLTDLITSAAVKKVYRKATLCVHPDKVQQKGATIQQKYIAEKVFDLLKEAWNKFNSEELF